MIVTEDQIQLQIQKQECLLELNTPIRTDQKDGPKRDLLPNILIFIYSRSIQSGTVRVQSVSQTKNRVRLSKLEAIK